MPRVSAEHLAARRQQILDAARTCFLRDGFHVTSMHDVTREAGLSVGAVYRYFKSKDELVRAIAESIIGGAEEVLGEILQQEPPVPLLDALDRALAYVEVQTEENGALRIAIQVWAEALRDPGLAEFVAATYNRLRHHFVEIAERARRSGELPADTDAEAAGAVLFGMVPSYILQRVLTGRPDRTTYLAGVRALLG
jgi:AcrR family transcriptional regulator